MQRRQIEAGHEFPVSFDIDEFLVRLTGFVWQPFLQGRLRCGQPHEKHLAAA